MGAIDEDAREMCLEIYKEERRKIKRCIYPSKKEIQEQFERKMNYDVNGNRKLFWKKVSEANGGKVENFNRIKDGNGRIILKKEARNIWKDHFKDTQEQDEVHKYGFDSVAKDFYFGEEPISRMKIEVRVGKLKNGKTAGEVRSQER